jgi:hypothetical protein
MFDFDHWHEVWQQWVAAGTSLGHQMVEQLGHELAAAGIDLSQFSADQLSQLFEPHSNADMGTPDGAAPRFGSADHFLPCGHCFPCRCGTKGWL